MADASGASAEATGSARPWGAADRALWLARGVAKRLRLTFVRLRYPGTRFGRRVEARRGLTIRRTPGATILIGDRCVLDNDMTIECEAVLAIGARTIFGHHCTIAVAGEVSIGEDCLIAELVSIRDHDHCFDRFDLPVRLQGRTVKPVRIGRNVWVGAKATITKGVTIGDNAVIGANAVVTRDIPAGAIAVGVPARVIRYRQGTAARGV